MQNQFYYTEQRKVEEGKTVDVQDSFNIEKVTITFSNPDGTSLVVLNDFREQYIDMPVVGPGGKVKVEKRKMQVCSEIKLNTEDSARFRQLFEIK